MFVGGEATRTALDYADAVAFLCEEAFPEARAIVPVQDNLNTRTAASLHKRFPAERARRLAERLEIHCTPKHGSWLNMAEPTEGR